MAEANNTQGGNVFSANDTLDINELASLNEDITPEFIEQLQNKLTQNAESFSDSVSTFQDDDSKLFEEVNPTASEELPQKEDETEKASPKVKLDESIDDNFIKKYKAKLNKQKGLDGELDSEASPEIDNIKLEAFETNETQAVQDSTNLQESKDIEKLSGGNIIEKPATKEQIEYNDSLDFLDDNVKYSKYVIYINPENTEFIESLTVKERKNLINRILREQDDIAITKKRLGLIQTVIKHSIVAIITVAIAIPVIYFTINASLEASINNYRRSQSIFKTLYKEKGKIKSSLVNPTN